MVTNILFLIVSILLGSGKSSFVKSLRTDRPCQTSEKEIGTRYMKAIELKLYSCELYLTPNELNECITEYVADTPENIGIQEVWSIHANTRSAV